LTGRAGILVAGLLILLTGLVYLPSLWGGYVYDDHRFVRLNPAVTDGVALSCYFTEPATQTVDGSFGGLYRPVRTLSFRAVALVSKGPAGQRIAGLLIHLTNGFLLWVLLRRLLGDGPAYPPLLGALAFLLHPLATESVAWISSRGDLLAMTGILGGLVFHLAGGRAARLVSLLFFALGLLSKESAVVLPFLLMVVDGFRFGASGVRAGIRSYVPYLVVLGLYFTVRYLVLGAGHFGQGEGLGLTGMDLLASVMAGEVYYVAATLFPWWLSFELDLAATAVPATLGFFAVVVLLIAAVRLRHSARLITLAILWFLVALIPVTVLQFALPLKIEVANRFAYPALAAIGMLLAFVATRCRPAPLLAVIVLAAFVPLSVARAAAFHDEAGLWQDVLKAQPGHGRALYGLGFVEFERRDFVAAREYLARAAGTDASDPKVAYFLGQACSELMARSPVGSAAFRKHLGEARSAYRAALKLWVGGAKSGRGLFRSVALDAAWLAMIAGDPDLAAMNVEIMLQADGALERSDRTVRHLEDLSRFLEQVRYPELAAELNRQARAPRN